MLTCPLFQIIPRKAYPRNPYSFSGALKARYLQSGASVALVAFRVWFLREQGVLYNGITRFLLNCGSGTHQCDASDFPLALLITEKGTELA